MIVYRGALTGLRPQNGTSRPGQNMDWMQRQACRIWLPPRFGPPRNKGCNTPTRNKSVPPHLATPDQGDRQCSPTTIGALPTKIWQTEDSNILDTSNVSIMELNFHPTQRPEGCRWAGHDRKHSFRHPVWRDTTI
jgi:hypothetical protein